MGWEEAKVLLLVADLFFVGSGRMLLPFEGNAETETRQ